MVGYRKPEIGCAMTTPMDDALAAIGRQLSVAYLPTVRWPLPRELEDLVVQLVAFEMDRARYPRRLCNALWHSRHRIPAPLIRQSNDTPIGGYRREPHHKIGLEPTALPYQQPVWIFGSD
jgi:hypothetical protein